MSAEESAERCVKFILKIYDNPHNAFDVEYELTEEGRHHIEHFGTATREMIEWEVDPVNFGCITIQAQPEIHAHVVNLLVERRLSHHVTEDGAICVSFP